MAIKKLILILDDDVELASLISKLLDDQGIDSVRAENAEQALEMLKKMTPDLILADVLLPGIDGWEFCKYVKGDIRTKFIPVIMLTANTDGTLEMRTYENHAEACLTKPFSNDELIGIIQSLLMGRR